MDTLKMLIYFFVVAVFLSVIVTFVFSKSKKGAFLQFLVNLKNIIVGVLIASCIMLISLIYKNDLNVIGEELNTVALSIHKYGIYFQGAIVVSAVLGLFVGFLVSKTFLLLEIILGAIGENKYVPEGKSSFVFVIITIIKNPFLFVLNVILALVVSVMIASIMEALGMVAAAQFQFKLKWQISLVASTWISAFIGYIWARSQSKLRKKLETV